MARATSVKALLFTLHSLLNYGVTEAWTPRRIQCAESRILVLGAPPHRTWSPTRRPVFVRLSDAPRDDGKVRRELWSVRSRNLVVQSVSMGSESCATLRLRAVQKCTISDIRARRCAQCDEALSCTIQTGVSAGGLTQVRDSPWRGDDTRRLHRGLPMPAPR